MTDLPDHAAITLETRLREAAEHVATCWMAVRVSGGTGHSGVALSEALDEISGVLDEIAEAEGDSDG